MKTSLIGMLCLLPVAASAQTIAVSATDQDYPDLYRQWFDVPLGAPFDVVVWANTAGHDTQFAEFAITEITDDHPGVFRVALVTLDPTVDLEFTPAGRFQLSYPCEPASERLELVRATYFDFAAVMGSDYLITVRGLGEGDELPSSFDGSPGFRDCDGADVLATMGGTDAVCTGTGVIGPEGSLILNPTPFPCPADESSFGALKQCFRERSR